MKASELTDLLLNEGCNHGNFRVGNVGGADDAFCLTENYGTWEVFYTERGTKSPIFSSTSETEACEFFYKQIMEMEHWHIVGFFKEKKNLETLEKSMKEKGIIFHRNDIPYGGPNDLRYRIFVIGKEKFKANEHFSELPITDT